MAYSETPYDLFKMELIQLAEEGCSIEELKKEYEEIKPEDPDKQKLASRLFKKAARLKPEKDFPYTEPSDLEKIKRKRPRGSRIMRNKLSEAELKNRIWGAWLGRAAGCMLGKPVEPLGYNPSQMAEILKAHNAYPITEYLPRLERNIPASINYSAWNQEYTSCFRGNITKAVRDDDMDYTILGLYYIEKFGFDFTPQNVASSWLSLLPYHRTYTAERVTYYNLMNNLEPPDSARYMNPYREWIGAQIRADGFGYVTPGNPERAADLAYRDASISHVKNGIYGEMLMAAIISAALVGEDLNIAIDAGLAEIPKTSRLYDAVIKVRQWVAEDNNPLLTMQKIYGEYGKYHCVHTINNAALVIMALGYSGMDFERGITLAVTGGYDTDCNGATVGSILGAVLGAEALPQKWIAPLNDTLESCVFGFASNKISSLAERTFIQAQKFLA